MTELYPYLQKMAKLIDHRIWLEEDLKSVEVRVRVRVGQAN